MYFIRKILIYATQCGKRYALVVFESETNQFMQLTSLLVKFENWTMNICLSKLRSEVTKHGEPLRNNL